MKTVNIYDEKKLLAMLSERGCDYPSWARVVVFRDCLYVKTNRGDKFVGVFKLPLPMSAEVESELPIEQTPFSRKFKPGIYIPDTCAETTQLITNAKTFQILSEMDKKFIGTADYMGLAYFWNYDYRHDLRDASAAERVKVHAAFLANDLPLDGASADHLGIIRKVTSKN